MSEFVFIMTCWLSGERSLPFGLLVVNIIFELSLKKRAYFPRKQAEGFIVPFHTEKGGVNQAA